MPAPEARTAASGKAEEGAAQPTGPPAAPGSAERAQGVRRAWIGGLVFGVALIITLATYSSAESDAEQTGSGTYVVLWGPMLFGAVFCIIGIVQQVRSGKAVQAGWKPDPLHRHQHRYWDGTSWTSQVADQGEQGVDAITITDTALEGNTAASPSVPCELCGKRLDEKDPLNQHMAEVHGISPGGQPTGPAT